MPFRQGRKTGKKANLAETYGLLRSLLLQRHHKFQFFIGGRTMRYIELSLALLLMAVLAPATQAGEEADNPKPRRGDLRQMILEEFDADGDGELNEEERAAAREEMRSRRGGKGRRGGRGQGGPEGPPRGPEGRQRGDREFGERGPEFRRGPEGRPPRGEGRAKGRGGPGMGGPDPEKVFDHFDVDGDEQLSREEFGRMVMSVRIARSMHGQRGSGGPPQGLGERGPRGDRGGPGPGAGRPSGRRRGGPDGDKDSDRPRRSRRPGPPPESEEGVSIALPVIDETT